MRKKTMFFGIYAGSAIALFSFREPLIRWIEMENTWYLNVLTALIALLVAIIPVIPYGIVAAILGAKYGSFLGAGINIVVSVAAAIILFGLVRGTFTEEGRYKIAHLKGVSFLTKLAERKAFMSILFARLLPIVPAQAINAFAAITKMPWKPYIYATILGKIPFILLVTLIGDQFFNETNYKEIAFSSMVYLLFLGVVYGIYRLYTNKK
ncbi:TVP38/TMEM64 family protein [Cohnella phaseoli]|uniref:TVP38/TMEM64 family membrane protein n=1 Tax=Cohnella phaseoli TaxID=456490 RepID=A0A3D9JPZ0_9BACL|nr:VTT domain-containing protein [Cohnella phaseoli]RED76094.1 putative membrane protein YdjX (TVP38/TMEM64 family) [Cohnella phaseoli]